LVEANQRERERLHDCSSFLGTPSSVSARLSADRSADLRSPKGALAADFFAPTMMSSPGRTGVTRAASRNRRFTRLRTTAPPTALPATNPKPGGGAGCVSAGRCASARHLVLLDARPVRARLSIEKRCAANNPG